MLLWDREFLSKVKKLGLQVLLYKRYVDDVVCVLRSVEPGWYFCKKGNKLVFDREHPTASLAEDARTFTLLQVIANSLDPGIKMMFEVPSMMQNGRLPVLDLELFIVNNKVQLSFFKKPVSSPFTIMYASVLPANQKRNSLFHECLRTGLGLWKGS